MNKFDMEIKKMAAAEEQDVPENVKERIRDTLSSLPEKAKCGRRMVFPRVLAGAVCAAVMALFVLPNISVTYARAAGSLPIIGDIIRVFTVRNYEYSDGSNEMQVNVPAVDGADELNREIEELAETTVNEFYSTLREGHSGVYVDYEVVSNNSAWFTIKLLVSEVKASGNNYFKYYHIDKTTGDYVRLSDIISDTAPISDEILRMMKNEMAQDADKEYFIGEDGFDGIDGDQDFYFDDMGNLVIAFDEYQVAPGYMGCPEFKISPEVYRSVMGEKFPAVFNK